MSKLGQPGVRKAKNYWQEVCGGTPLEGGPASQVRQPGCHRQEGRRGLLQHSCDLHQEYKFHRSDGDTGREAAGVDVNDWGVGGAGGTRRDQGRGSQADELLPRAGTPGVKHKICLLETKGWEGVKTMVRLLDGATTWISDMEKKGEKGHVLNTLTSSRGPSPAKYPMPSPGQSKRNDKDGRGRNRNRKRKGSHGKRRY